jgi:hypothetical protein
MDNSQTPLDYKEYFSNKFILLFKNLINSLLKYLPEECQERQNILKIHSLVDKLNYEKIIKKMEENTKLMETLTALSKNNFEPSLCAKLYSAKNKYWTILPSFNLNEILILIQNSEQQKEIYSYIHDMHVCSVTYSRVVEQINQTREGQEFNPFDSIGNVAENLDVETLFKGVEVKNISAYEMLMETIINQQMDNKMGDYMNNIKEEDVNEAASKLNNVLQSENFTGNKQTSKILSEMLSNIKSEVINLKNNTNDMKGKQGVEQLLGIAQKVAGSMMSNIKESNVSVLEIWDATSSLAKNTVQSDALNIVDNLIRSNIEANMKGMANNNTNQNTTTTTTTESTETSEQVNESRRRRDKKNKSKKQSE